MNEENCNVVGRIVNCSVEESAMTEGKPDAEKMRPICFDCHHLVGSLSIGLLGG